LELLSPQLVSQIEKGIKILKEGGLVAYPTDTVYGLGADIRQADAVNKVYLVKSRPRNMAFPLLVSSVGEIEKLAAEITPLARGLIEAFLPGALTLVLWASNLVPPYLRTETGTVALRIPAHPVPIALIRGVGGAIVGTSANLSGRPSPVTAEEVRFQLGDRVDMIIDGGRCAGKESTIVDATGKNPVVLREGAISKNDIDTVYTKVSSGNGG
jgi:L-threonylcarbamoyladenylate synthase